MVAEVLGGSNSIVPNHMLNGVQSTQGASSKRRNERSKRVSYIDDFQRLSESGLGHRHCRGEYSVSLNNCYTV